MMNRHWGLGATASLLYYNKKMVYSDTAETADKMSETALALIGFGELGLGMTGWFRAGIGYRF